LIACQIKKIYKKSLLKNYFFIVVSALILDVSVAIEDESGVTGAVVVDVSVDIIVDVESLVASVLVVELSLHAAKNAENARTISTFFILINLDFYDLFLV
jgi:hypothetical protein